MCNCRYKPPTLPKNNLIRIFYIGNEQVLIGHMTKTKYGKRKTGQTFYIKQEDFDFSTMVGS